jgi:hypothetical protein
MVQFMGDLTMPADRPGVSTRWRQSRRASRVDIAMISLALSLCMLPAMAQAQGSSRARLPLSALSWSPAAGSSSEEFHALVSARLLTAVADSQPPRRFRRGAIGFLLGASTGVAVAYLVNRGNGEGRLENYFGIPLGLGIVGFVAGFVTAR